MANKPAVVGDSWSFSLSRLYADGVALTDTTAGLTIQVSVVLDNDPWGGPFTPTYDAGTGRWVFQLELPGPGNVGVRWLITAGLLTKSIEQSLYVEARMPQVVVAGQSNLSWDQGPPGPPGSGAAWGGITGDIATQTDLQTALGLKANASSLAGYQPLDTELTQIAAIAPPVGDRVLFYDQSAGSYALLTLGTNLSITGTTLNATGGGSVAWGAITGTLSSQTDLNTALSALAPLASPVFTGAPTIPSFTNATHTHANAAGGGQLDHTTALTNIGTNTHAQIDTHLASAHAPVGAKYIVQQADATLTAEQALGALATGVLKSTTTTGVLSIAVPGTDFETAGATATHAALTGTAVHGLGTMSTQAAGAVAITGGSITGITDLTIADGGTGQSTAQLAINALSAVAGATNEFVLTKDTGTGNAIFKAVPAAGSVSFDNLTDVAITSPATGQVVAYNGSLWVNRYDKEWNVKDFGATGDGTTLDTTAIQAAVTAGELYATNNGLVSPGTLYFPAGGYKSNTITLTMPWFVRGAGFQSSSVFLPTGASATTDLFIFTPATPSISRAFGLLDIKLYAQTATDGRDLYRINLSGGSRAAAEFYVDRCWLDACGGYSILLNAGTVASPSNNPTLFCSYIDRSIIWGGISLIAAADSIAIRNNIITGTKGVIVDLLSGASAFEFRGNNVTADGMLQIEGAHKPIIADNYFELLAGHTVSTTDGALIDLRGNTNQLAQPIIRNNTIAAQLVTGTHGLYLGATLFALVDGNNFNSAGVGFDIKTSASANHTLILGNNINAAGTGPTISDAGGVTRSGAFYALSGIPTIFNHGGADSDFIVRGDTDNEMIYGDAGLGFVGIGVAPGGAKFDVGDVPTATPAFRSRANADGNAYIQLTDAGATAEWSSLVATATTLAIGAAGATRLSLSAASVSPLVTLVARAGTATAGTAPIKMQSGTLLTAAEAGAVEYDGKAAYFSPASGARAVIETTHLAAIQADLALTAASGVQSAFPAANDAVTLAGATTYLMEGFYWMTLPSTTTRTIAMAFAAGGGLTLTSMVYEVQALHSSTLTIQTASWAWSVVNSNASTVLTATGVTTNAWFKFQGIVRVNVGGTLTPQINFSANPGVGPLMKIGSWIKFTPIGSNTVAAIGPWA